MQFVYPGFLFALSALSVPIIIHLFNFRRFKKIAFTNVRFLQEIKQDTRSRSKLKHLLILLARLLAIAFLVLAFAQPLIPANKNLIVAGSKTVGIYIDNSFSMDAVGKNGSLIESAKRKAREIANAFQPADHFQLLTNDFEARHQRIVNREEFLQLVDEVKSGSAVKSLSEVVTRQNDALKNSNDASQKIIFYEISDFQKSVTDLDVIKNDSALQINLIPLAPTSEKNIFIDTCSLSAPFIQLNTQNELTIKIRNTSNEEVENVPVKLFINGVQRSLSSINLPALSTSETKLSFTINHPGWQQAQVSIADDPVIFDDNYYFSFEVKEFLSVLCINEQQPSPYIVALFNSDAFYQLKNSSVNLLDYSSFKTANLIILNNLKDISSGLSQELNKYLLTGGALVVFPAVEINATSYESFFRSMNVNPYAQLINEDDKVTFVEKLNPVFENVFEKKNSSENTDYPTVTRHYRFSGNTQSAQEVLMKLQSGDVFMSAVPKGKGKAFICASPLDETSTSLPRHALFVPLMLKAAMSGFNSSGQPQVVGKNEAIEIPAVQLNGENMVHLINKEESFDVIPEIKMLSGKPVAMLHNRVVKSGNYSLLADNKLISSVAYNYDRRESDLSRFSADELKSIADQSGNFTVSLIDGDKDLTHSITSQNEGKRLWKYCIWLALLFLAAEVLIIRYMFTKKNSTTNT